MKSLYRKARNGEMQNFAGISSPFKMPQHQEIIIDTSKYSIEEAASMVLKEIGRYI